MAPLFANKEEEYSFIHWKGCNFDCVGEVNSTCVYNLGFQVRSRITNQQIRCSNKKGVKFEYFLPNF